MSETLRAGDRLARPAPLEWLYLAAGLALVHHYRWIVDDAFVYYRYVDNLLFLDVGLVYNAGEYVEGFSSPLFCLLLVSLRALRVSYSTILLGIALVSFALFWYGLVVLNRRLSPAGVPVLNFPLAYLCVNYGSLSFFTSGLETPIVHLMAPAYALYLLGPASLLPGLLVALSPLVRPELALALALAVSTAWVRSGRFPWRVVALAGVLNGAWLAFRIYYYADLFPNPFYLKNETQWIQGLRYLENLTTPYHFVAVLGGFALLAALVQRLSTRSGGEAAALRLGERGALLAIAAAVGAFVVRVGGTHVHYWYLAFSFSLALCALAGLLESALKAFGWQRQRLLAAAAMVGFAAWAFTWHPPQLLGHPFSSEGEQQPVHGIDDPIWHRRHPELQFGDWKDEVRFREMEIVRRSIAERGYESVAMNAWCRNHYVNHDQRIVHRFGLTDAILARTDSPSNKPGHKGLLAPRAEHIARILRESGRPGRGMYRRAIETSTAPRWVEANIGSIEIIERKIYNRHNFLENLRLAFSFPERIPTLPSGDS